MITGVTLFSGGGLVEAALPQVKWVGALEIDPACAAHFQLAHPGVPIDISDVCRVKYGRYRGAGYLHVSPSCRNASVANSEAGETEEDIQAGFAVGRALRAIRPKVFTLENVQGYAKFKAFHHILATLEELGYRYDWAVYNSADFGTPQTRKRLYVRAWLKKHGPLPHVVRTHASMDKLQKMSGNLFDEPLLPWRGWYRAIEDLIPTLPDAKFADWQMRRLRGHFEESFLCRIQGESSDLEIPADQPMANLQASHGPAKYRAFVVDGQNTQNRTLPRAGDEPMLTVLASAAKSLPRAFVMDSQNSGPHARPNPRMADDPMFTILASVGKCQPRAYLTDCRGASPIGEERVAALRGDTDPAATVTANAHKSTPLAILVHGTSSLELRSSEEPAATVCASVHGKASKPLAYLVEGDTAGNRAPIVRDFDEPALTIKAGEGGRVHRAILVGNQSAWGDKGQGTTVSVRHDEEPALTIAANPAHKHRGIVGGRVVRLTSRALGRFQDLPDDYPLPGIDVPGTERLACTIIGQGVAGRLQQAIALPLLERVFG